MNDPNVTVTLTHEQLTTIQMELHCGMERSLKQISAVSSLADKRMANGAPMYPDMTESAAYWQDYYNSLRRAMIALKLVRPMEAKPRTRLTSEQLRSLFDDAEQNSPQDTEPFFTITYSEERADCAESDRRMHPERSDLCSYPERI